MIWDAILGFSFYFFVSSVISLIYYCAAVCIHTWNETCSMIVGVSFSDSKAALAYRDCVFKLKGTKDSRTNEYILGIIPVFIAALIIGSDVSRLWLMLPALMLVSYYSRGAKKLHSLALSIPLVKESLTFLDLVDKIGYQLNTLEKLSTGTDAEKNRFYSIYRNATPESADEFIWWTIYDNLLQLKSFKSYASGVVACIAVAFVIWVLPFISMS